MGLLGKIKGVASDAIDKSTNALTGTGLQEKLSNEIIKAFSLVTKEREQYYIVAQKPTRDSIEYFIDNYVKENGLITSPMGIHKIIVNHINMIYDIGKSYNTEDINNTLLASILLSAISSIKTDAIILKGDEAHITLVDDKALKSMVTALSSVIAQELAKSVAARLIPVAGDLVISTWTKHTTQKVAKFATEVFSKKIIINSENKINDFKLENNNDNDNEIELLKIQTLINLMNIDGNIDDEELSFIKLMIDNSTLKGKSKESLYQGLEETQKYTVDYSKIKGSSEDTLYLLIDLIALAKIDNEFHPAEKLYIKNVSKELDFDLNDLEDLMA